MDTMMEQGSVTKGASPILFDANSSTCLRRTKGKPYRSATGAELLAVSALKRRVQAAQNTIPVQQPGFGFSFGVFQDFYSKHEPFASSGNIAVIGTTTMGRKPLNKLASLSRIRTQKPREPSIWAPLSSSRYAASLIVGLDGSRF